MVRFTPTDERLHSKAKDCLQAFAKLLSPTTELYVASEVHVQRLLASLDDAYPAASVGIVGHKFSGKSALLNAIATAEVLPPNTIRVMPVSPKPLRNVDRQEARELEPLLFKKSTNKAIAKGVENCREHIISEEERFLDEFADRKMCVPVLPLMNPEEMHCTTVEFLDCPAETCVYAPQLCQAASDVRQPNILNADCFWNCVDTRVLTRLINVLIPKYASDAIGIEDDDLRRIAEETIESASGDQGTTDLAQKAANDILYHVYSRCNADLSTPATSKAHAVSLTTFILTHSDEVMAGRDRNFESEIRKSILEGFIALIRLATDGEVTIRPDQVIFFSAPAVGCTLRLLGKERPSIQEIYDYCEDNMGLAFMQTIDSIEEEPLRRIVARYAEDEIYNRSGAQAIVDMMRLVDYNSAKLWMRRICVGGIECVDQLALAGEAAQPALSRQLNEAQLQLTDLLKELEWAVSTAQRIKNYCIKTMIATQVQFANRELDNFLQQCLEDLRYVLEHREMEWYRERHACTAVEMLSSLKKLEAFTDSYMIKRAFLERKIQIRDKENLDQLQASLNRRNSDDGTSSMNSSKFSAHHGSVAATSKAANTNTRLDLDAQVEARILKIRESVAAMKPVEPTVVLGTNPFLEDNAEQFLDALEAEKQGALVDFFVRVCHHIRDRYEELVPELIARLSEQKSLALDKLHDLIKEPIQEAYARLGIPFDIEAAMTQLFEVDLIQANRRRLNSFLRELPEHVASAAIEISNQWYQPAQSVEIKGLKTTIPLTSNPIPPAFQTSNTTTNNNTTTQASTSFAAGSALNAINNSTSLPKRRTSLANKAPVANTLTTASVPTIEPLTIPPTVGDWGRTSAARQALFPSAPSELAFDPNREPHHKIHPQLLYVYESWRLTFEAVELHQLSQFNVHDLSVAATNANNIVVEYLNGYVESLEEGVIAQKGSIQEIQEAQQVMSSSVGQGENLARDFQHILELLNGAIVTDINVAEAQLAREREYE